MIYSMLDFDKVFSDIVTSFGFEWNQIAQVIHNYQTLHLGFATMLSVSLHWKAFWKSSVFLKVAKTRTMAGGWTSTRSWLTKDWIVFVSHHPLAYPMKNNWKIEIHHATKKRNLLSKVFDKWVIPCKHITLFSLMYKKPICVQTNLISPWERLVGR